MKIVLLDGYGLNSDLDWTALQALGDCDLYDRTPVDDDDEICRRIGDSELVITHKTPLHAEVIARLPKLRYIGVMGTGYDVIDIAAARARGITATNVPTYAEGAVAQFAFSLLLEVTGQVGLHNRLVHEGTWSHVPDFTFWERPLFELKSKTLGLVGYGHIAQQVSRMAHAFGMGVIYWNHRPKQPVEPGDAQVPLVELLRTADVVSLHVIQTPETVGIINARALAHMKPTAILVNTARGKLVVEADVAAALNEGKLYAYATDVVGKEPIASNNPLLTAKNCYITPHIAWAPHETRQRLLDITVKNLEAFLGGKPQNVIQQPEQHPPTNLAVCHNDTLPSGRGEHEVHRRGSGQA